jgi:hypothetical protein
MGHDLFGGQLGVPSEALTDEGLEATVEGTPHGGPLSPLLANLLLDGVDKELERRGHRFVRYAGDCNLYVKSVRAGQRVLASVTRFLERRLKLAVNAAKSAVDRPWRRTVLGFTFTGRRPNRRPVGDKALKACKEEVRRRIRDPSVRWCRGGERSRGLPLSRLTAQKENQHGNPLSPSMDQRFGSESVRSPRHC